MAVKHQRQHRNRLRTQALDFNPCSTIYSTEILGQLTYFLVYTFVEKRMQYHTPPKAVTVSKAFSATSDPMSFHKNILLNIDIGKIINIVAISFRDDPLT